MIFSLRKKCGKKQRRRTIKKKKRSEKSERGPSFLIEEVRLTREREKLETNALSIILIELRWKNLDIASMSRGIDDTSFACEPTKVYSTSQCDVVTLYSRLKYSPLRPRDRMISIALPDMVKASQYYSPCRHRSSR